MCTHVAEVACPHARTLLAYPEIYSELDVFLDQYFLGESLVEWFRFTIREKRKRGI